MSLIKGGALWNPSTPSESYEEEWDPLNPPSGWVCVANNESYARFEADLGDGRVMLRTQHWGTEAMLDRNQELYNDSEGKRWGDGRVIGSMPMNLYFQKGLHEANVQRDLKYIKKVWNDPDNRKFRSFKGTI